MASTRSAAIAVLFAACGMAGCAQTPPPAPPGPPVANATPPPLPPDPALGPNAGQGEAAQQGGGRRRR